MNSNKILVFDLYSEFAHYRKFNTTTSPLTYPIPTRTAISGMLGAILGEGITRFNFYGIFSKKDTGIAIQVLNPIKKVNMGFNLMNTKKSFFEIEALGKTRVGYELLKDPKFRIFYSTENEEVFEKICKKIQNNSHHYTPYMGLSQFTAKIDYMALTEGEIMETEDFVDIATAINMRLCERKDSIKFDYEKKYSVNVMPIDMELDEVNERIVTEYSDVLIEITGSAVCVKLKEYIKTEFGNITYL